MAGDWIKVETVTPDKAEVSNIAARLGITPEEAFGRLFRVWTWAQNVSANGHVSVRSLSVVDSHARLAGFGQAMAEEGWLKANGDGMIVPNWERHLSKGAKKRALDTERKRGNRANSVLDPSASQADKSGTREEKRRVNSPSLRSGERATRLPKDWELPRAWGEWALKEQPTWDADQVRKVALMFKNHWLAKGGRDAAKLDWQLTWHNWVLKEGARKVVASVTTIAQRWKAGAEPDDVLKRVLAQMQLEAWQPGETHGQVRDRIVDAGGEELLKPGKAA